MRAAAKLDRVLRHREHPDDVAVLLLEDRDSALLARLVDRQDLREDRRVLEHLAVHEILDLLDLLARQRLVVREVEAEDVRTNPRALLLRMLAEHRAQSPVQEVRRRVVPPRRRASRVIDLEANPLHDRDRALLDKPLVHDEPRERPLRIRHANTTTVSADFSTVTNLPTALRVERRLLDDELDAIPRLRAIDERTRGFVFTRHLDD